MKSRKTKQQQKQNTHNSTTTTTDSINRDSDALTLDQLVKIRNLKTTRHKYLLYNNSYFEIFVRVIPYGLAFYFGNDWIASAEQVSASRDLATFRPEELTKDFFVISIMALQKAFAFKDYSLDVLNKLPIAELKTILDEFISKPTYFFSLVKFVSEYPYMDPHSEFLKRSLKCILTILAGYMIMSVGNQRITQVKNYWHNIPNEIYLPPNTTTDEADRLIQELEAGNKKLYLHSNTTTLIMAMFGVLITGFSAYEEGFPDHLKPRYFTEMDITLLMLFASVYQLFFALQIYQSGKDKKQISRNIGEYTKAIRQLLPETIDDRKITEVQGFAGDDSATSHITLTFNNYFNDRKEKITGDALCQIFIEVSNKHQLKISDYQHNVVIFSLDATARNIKVDSFRMDFEDAINKHSKLKIFSRQVKGIMKMLDMNGHYRPKLNEAGDKIRCFSFEPSEKFNELTLTQIKSVFPTANINLNSNTGMLHIEGNEPGNMNLMHLFEKKAELLVANKIVNVATDSLPADPNKQEELILAENNSKAPKRWQREDGAAAAAPSITATPSIIQWRSAMFNPDDPNCQVKPIEGAGLAKNKFFSFFALKKEDFAGYPRAHKKFSAMGEVPRLANGRFGAEGIVFINKKVKDTKGISFIGSCQMKALGNDLGDARAYAEEEQAPTGEMLYVWKGFDPRSH